MAKEITLQEAELAIKLLEKKIALKEAQNDNLIMNVVENSPGRFNIVDVRKENYDKDAKGNEKLQRLVR